ncbi:MAG: recombinase family protein [Schaalia turicensis]
METYTDQSVSTSDHIKKRPSYLRMAQDYKAGLLDAIICYGLDLLTRRPLELEDWIDRAKLRGVLLVTSNGDADLSSDGGRMCERIKAAVARAEVERKRVATISCTRATNATGRSPKSVRPMGYTTSGELIPCEAEAVGLSTPPSFEWVR